MADKKLLARLAEMGVIGAGEAVRMSDYMPTSKPLRRSFSAAKVTGLTSGWTTIPKPIDADIRLGLRKLRARSREECQNNDYLKKFLSLLKTNVIGSQGILLQSKVKDPDGKKDKLAIDAIETGWFGWCKKGICDVTGKMSWKMIQRLFLETLARDGEVLIRKVKNWKGNKYRFALQFLDVELLDVELNTELNNGHVIQMGVELNKWRRPVAYFLLTTKQTACDYSFAGRRYTRIPAEDIIHEFLPEWVWQTRGIPWAVTCLARLNMLDGFEEAELVASRAGASTFGTYDPIETEGSIAPNLDGQFEKDADGNFIQDFEAGTVSVTPDGYKFNLVDPQHPNAAFKDFVKAMLRAVSAGLGVSYNSLANDLEGVNYNSLRKGALDDQDAWMLLQDWVTESLCDNVFSDWLQMSLLSQALTVKGKPLDVLREEKYQAVRWQPRRWQAVDPAKMMTAHEKALALRTTSPQKIILESGQDPEDILDDWEQWDIELKKRNLTTNQPAPAAGSFVIEDEETDEDDDENKNS